MTRFRGWGEQHGRVVDYVSDVCFECASIFVAVCLSGVAVSVTFKGALNGLLFVLYVRYVLAPALNVGETVRKLQNYCF
jgi:hypothetical protein